MHKEIESKVAHAGELLIRAAAVIGTLPAEEQEHINRISNGQLVDAIAVAIRAAAAISPQVSESLKTHGPAGFQGRIS